MAVLIAYSGDFWVTKCITGQCVIWLPPVLFSAAQRSVCSGGNSGMLPWSHEIQKRKPSLPKAWRNSYRLIAVNAFENLFQRFVFSQRGWRASVWSVQSTAPRNKTVLFLDRFTEGIVQPIWHSFKVEINIYNLEYQCYFYLEWGSNLKIHFLLLDFM